MCKQMREVCYDMIDDASSDMLQDQKCSEYSSKRPL